MNVVILTPSLSGGGAERVSSIVANGFAEYGHTVTIICVYSDRCEYETNPKIKIRSAISDKPSVFGLVNRSATIRKYISSICPDVVLSFVLGDAVLSETCGIPFVQTLRNDPWHDGMSFAHRVLRLIAYILADVVVFQTDQAMNYFPLSVRKKGVVLPNPVCVDALPTWKRSRSSKRFVSVGRLESQKNYKLLINAFALFLKTHPGYSLVIYGEGSQRAELQEQINLLGLERAVILHGRCQQVYERMADATAFVLSSDYEGVSNAMLEALCIGMPCIVTDHSPGGASKYIVNGENGLLAEVGNVGEMATKMAEVVDDWSFACRLGDNAALIRKRVSRETVLAQWEQVISNRASS